MWWAEGEFRKLKPIPEGGTLGDSFAAFRRATGKAHAEDRDYVTPPSTLVYLWEWFWAVAQGRPLGPEGIAMPIPSTEIRAWTELEGIQLLPWELKALRALDAAYLKVAAEKFA